MSRHYETSILNMESGSHYKSDHKKITKYTGINDLPDGEESEGDNIDMKPSNKDHSNCGSKTVGMSSLEKKILPRAIIGPAFIHGLSNKMTTPLPPLSSLPWMPNIKPLPPFESLMPPIISGANLDKMKSSHISSSLKSNNVSTCSTPTEQPKSNMSFKEKLSKSLFKNKGNSSDNKMGHYTSLDRKTSKNILSISAASMSSSTSPSGDSSSSTSSSGETQHERSHSRSSHHLVERRKIPKYGEAKPGTSINQILPKSLPRNIFPKSFNEILHKSFPSNSFQKSFKCKLNERYEEDNFYGRETPDSYEDKFNYKTTPTGKELKTKLSQRNISSKECSNSDEELLYCNELNKNYHFKKRDTYKHDLKRSIKSDVCSSSKSKKYSSKGRSKFNDHALLEESSRNSDRATVSKVYSKEKYRVARESRRREYKHCSRSNKEFENSEGLFNHEEYSEYDSTRESGECSSSSDSDSDDDMEPITKRSVSSFDNEAAQIQEQEEYNADEALHSDSQMYKQAENHLKSRAINYDCDSHSEDDEKKSPSSNYSRDSRKAIPLKKRLGIPTPTDSSSNYESDSNSSLDYKSDKPRLRKGPHTPDYPYEKSPHPGITSEKSEGTDSVDNEDCNYNKEIIKQPSIITKSNSSIKGSTCNYTTNHYKPTYSTNTSTRIDKFTYPRHEHVTNHSLNSSSSSNAYKSTVQGSVKESPVRSNLDARIKTMFGLKNSSSEDSPVKMDSSVSKPKFFKPLRDTPSPFRSRNTYLHWYKETYRIKKIDSNSSYSTVDPSERLKIGIQIKEYSEDFVSDQEQSSDDSRSMCTLQDIGISPPRFNRVQQILNFEDVEPCVDGALSSKKAQLNNVVKMNILPNTELELNFGSDSQKDHENTEQKAEDADHSSSKLMDLIVAKVLDDLKTSLKREISEDVIDLALTEQMSNKKLRID